MKPIPDKSLSADGLAVTQGRVRLLRKEMLVHWTEETSALCSADHTVYLYIYETGVFRKLFTIPPKNNTLSGRMKYAMARSWIRQRLMPSSGIGNVTKTAEGDVVVIFDRVYCYSDKSHDRPVDVIHCDASPGFATPLRGGMAVHGITDNIYFGEYLNGHQRDIRIFCVNASSRSMQECWRFSRQEIKHIHAIHYDRFRSRLWICTGDLDHESNIYYTDDEFSSVHKFGGGDQSWRAIAMLFDEHGMEWGMDAGKDAPAEAVNYIYRYDFITGISSKRTLVGNPVYAACEFADGTAIMQTTYEPGRPQATPEAAALWRRDQQGDWANLLEISYGITRPRQGTGAYGYICLPQGVSPADRLLFTPINCGNGSHMLYEWTSDQVPATNSVHHA